MPPPLPPLPHASFQRAPLPRAPVHRRIIGSLLAALVGWVTLTFFIWMGLQYIFGPGGIFQSASVEGFALVAYVISLTFISVWLFTLLPLYLAVPPDSTLWRWPGSMGCGLGSGLLVMIVFAGVSPSQLLPAVLAVLFFVGLPGAITGLFVALTARWFVHAPGDLAASSPPPLPPPFPPRA